MLSCLTSPLPPSPLPSLPPSPPNRMEMAVRIHTGTDGIDYECSNARAGPYHRQQSPLSTIPSKSPPNSTDSLEHCYSSGVDSPLNQSISDFSSAANFPPIRESTVQPSLVICSHSFFGWNWPVSQRCYHTMTMCCKKSSVLSTMRVLYKWRYHSNNVLSVLSTLFT